MTVINKTVLDGPVPILLTPATLTLPLTAVREKSTLTVFVPAPLTIVAPAGKLQL